MQHELYGEVSAVHLLRTVIATVRVITKCDNYGIGHIL